MHAEFGYSQEEMDRIEQSLSHERLGPYLSLAGGDLRRAIGLYERTTSLSEALYGLLQGLEVTLRNAMHRELSDGIGREDWYDAIKWQLAQQEQIASAKDSLSKKGKQITPGKMVAELTFGFWVGLIGPKYSVASSLQGIPER
jgi:hypothetical protein